MTGRFHDTDAFTRVFPDAAAPIVTTLNSRVVLAGEHLGRCGLPQVVAPAGPVFAVAAPRTDTAVHIRFRDFPADPMAFDVNDELSRDVWTRCAQLALRALRQQLRLKQARGMDLLLCVGERKAKYLGGLEALTAGVAAAYLEMLDQDVTRRALAGLLNDTFKGAGGIPRFNAAATLLCPDRAVAKVDAVPPRAEPLPWPRELVVVVGPPAAAEPGDRWDPLVELIREVIEHQLQIELDPEIELATVGELWTGPLCLTHSEAQDIIQHAFASRGGSPDCLAKRLKTAASLSVLLDTPDPLRVLGDLAHHILLEMQAIESVRDCLAAGDLDGVCGLVNDSHFRCAKLYPANLGAVTEQRERALAAGACASRFAGPAAGFVHLVPRHRLSDFAVAFDMVDDLVASPDSMVYLLD